MNSFTIAQDLHVAFFGKPAVGELPFLIAWHGDLLTPKPWRCIPGYTRNVVAFAGMQQGGQIMIITHNGLNGWIDGERIAPV